MADASVPQELTIGNSVAWLRAYADKLDEFAKEAPQIAAFIDSVLRKIPFGNTPPSQFARTQLPRVEEMPSSALAEARVIGSGRLRDWLNIFKLLPGLAQYIPEVIAIIEVLVDWLGGDESTPGEA